MATAAASQRPVDVEMAKFQALQAGKLHYFIERNVCVLEIQELVNQQQQYNQQANENGMVQEELKLCNSNSNVFKLVGPALLKQDVENAKTNVAKRLEFIKNESEKVSKILTRKQTEAADLRTAIGEMQAGMQKAAAEAATAAAKAAA